MAIVFALTRLFDAVVARFALDGADVPHTFGWLATSEQMQGLTRVTWTPGDPGGSLGALTAPKYTGQTPQRQLATLGELCTIEITAFDPASSSNERAQYQAVREVLDAELRAIHLAAVGTYQIVSSAWVGGDRGRRSGATIRIVIAVQAPVLDLAIAIAPADTGAAIDLHELDVTEPIDVPPPVPSP